MSRKDGSKSVTIGHGLRARLLLSFIAISGFAVVAAVVGNYAFYAIGEALHQVTEKSVPPRHRDPGAGAAYRAHYCRQPRTAWRNHDRRIQDSFLGARTG